ncbi:unnamed protein product, partial [Musa acuminata var. zebrina]
FIQLPNHYPNLRTLTLEKGRGEYKVAPAFFSPNGITL